jgi:hypothetical protein
MEQKNEHMDYKNGRPSLTETGLKPKHRAFIRNLMSGKGINESGLAAGFGRRTGYDLMRKPAIRSELARQLEEVGVTDTYIAKKVKQGLNAKTVPQKENGKRYDDQFVRKQWADIAIKVKGGYAPEKIETEHKIVQLVIDSNMLKALKDSRALNEKEVKYLEHLPVEPGEIIDVEEIRETTGAGINAGTEAGPEDEGSGSGEEQGQGDEDRGGDEGDGRVESKEGDVGNPQEIQTEQG